MPDREEVAEFTDRAKAITYAIVGFSLGIGAAGFACWLVYIYFGPYLKMIL